MVDGKICLDLLKDRDVDAEITEKGSPSCKESWPGF